MARALVWFRQDLRIHDNPALHAACEYDEVLAVYIWDPAEKQPMGSAQQWWLHESLLALRKDLQAEGLKLVLLQKSPSECLSQLIKENEIDAVFWNRCYEPSSIERDQHIKKNLTGQGIKVQSFNASLLLEPWNIQTANGDYYKVFTPFWRKCRQSIAVPAALKIRHWPKCISIESDDIRDWQLQPAKPNWACKFSRRWEPGSKGAEKRLCYFTANALMDYKQGRDFPARHLHSGLSPHLHFGEISPQQIWREIQQKRHEKKSTENSLEAFLSELGWREFSYYLLYHFPQLPDTNFRSEFDHFPWSEDDETLRCWQSGQTGFPIVDAGMRELWQTGFMHNRVRMITASFLTKDLRIDWRKGAEWFWDTLVDADLASNCANWQWVAGCGADAAPYFRIFNPVLQSKKFDPEGKYIRNYVPELAKVPLKWIHNPWEANSKETGIILGRDYPEPLVDHAACRSLALEAYQKIKHSK